ncbi:MAG: c-type cytochrome [Rhodomicrobium sp.]
MKPTKITIAALAIACSSVFAIAGHAQVRHCSAGPESWPIEPSNYVTRNCAFCHGPGVQGRAVAPRLAGQHADYIVKQIEYFRDKSRNGVFALRYMSHVAVQIQPDYECEVAAYIESLPPEPAADNGNEALVPVGEALFQGGSPGDNIPACIFCHGPEGQGVGRIPRLGGLSYNYLQRRLTQWGEGFHSNAEIMPGVASKLSPDQIEAVASYLSYVR